MSILLKQARCINKETKYKEFVDIFIENYKDRLNSVIQS